MKVYHLVIAALVLSQSTSFAEVVAGSEEAAPVAPPAKSKALSIGEIRKWAEKEGTITHSGLTQDGRDCELNIFVTKGIDPTPSIYVSMGHRVGKKESLDYFGGYLQNHGPVSNQKSVQAKEYNGKLDLEFVVSTDDAGKKIPDNTQKIRIEKDQGGNKMKAIGSSTLMPKQVICTFEAAMS